RRSFRANGVKYLRAEERESFAAFSLLRCSRFIVSSYEHAWVAERLDKSGAAELLLDGRCHKITNCVPGPAKAVERGALMRHGVVPEVAVDSVEKELVKFVQVSADPLHLDVPYTLVPLRIGREGWFIGRPGCSQDGHTLPKCPHPARRLPSVLGQGLNSLFIFLFEAGKTNVMQLVCDCVFKLPSRDLGMEIQEDRRIRARLKYEAIRLRFDHWVYRSVDCRFSRKVSQRAFRDRAEVRPAPSRESLAQLYP